jgi:4-amino-4-deoxy-L-arabinose transferase-like glycosyltransferase
VGDSNKIALQKSAKGLGTYYKDRLGLIYIQMKLGRNLLWIFAPLLTALGLKIFLIASEAVAFNADEAIVALMARHIIRGERTVFFYGQAYMGSLDAFLVAGGFLIFGEHIWVIRLIQAMLYLGTLSTTAWIGKKAFGSWQVGILAAWLLAIPPVNITLYTTVSLGGYGEMLLLGNLILLVGLFIVDAWNLDRWRCVVWLSMLFGFLTGLGMWAFGLTLVYSLPVDIYLIAKLLGLIRKAPEAKIGRLEAWKMIATVFAFILAGLIIGASPWWLYAVNHGFAQLLGELRGGAIAGVEGLSWLGQVLQHAFNFLLLGITVIFGLRPPWEIRWLALPLVPLVLFFWIAVLVHMVKKIRPSEKPSIPLLMLAGVSITLVLGFLLTPFGADPSGRYFLPLSVPLSLFAAEMVYRLRDRWGNRALGLAGLILLFNLLGTFQTALRYPPGVSTQIDAVAQVDHRYDQALIDFLNENGETRGYTNYWVSYPLAFRSDESLIFVPRLPYHQDFRYTPRDDRYAPYDEMVDKAGRVAYITTNHPDLDRFLQRSFADLGVTWEERQLGDFHIFYHLSGVVRPSEIGLGRTSQVHPMNQVGIAESPIPTTGILR